MAPALKLPRSLQVKNKKLKKRKTDRIEVEEIGGRERYKVDGGVKQRASENEKWKKRMVRKSSPKPLN